MSEVLGEIAHLSDGRFVFVGSDDEKPETRYVGFQNEDGHQTRIKLSLEAARELRHMLSRDVREVRMPSSRFAGWRVV